MKLKDLKVGMILTLRNQSRYLFKCPYDRGIKYTLLTEIK